MSRIAIAGAGLAGRLFAWALAQAGHEVSVHDAQAGPAPLHDGHGAAAFTAAGMLSPLAELEKAEADVAAWGWRSLQVWPHIVSQLQGQGHSVPLHLRGSWLIAHRSDLGAAQRVLARLDQPELSAASTVQAIAPERLGDWEPALQRPQGLHAWLLPGEGLIHPLKAMEAFFSASPRVEWHWNQAVDRVAPGRLQLRDGRSLHADWAIDCRGLGAKPDLNGLRGVRGEVVALHAPGHGLTRPVRLLHPRHRVYLVPRSEQELLIGASEIESEDRSPVSLQSAVELMAAAHSLMPQLAEARITRLDRNLRPALPDNQPRLEVMNGLIRLNGLYRHGWLLAPALIEAGLGRAGLRSALDFAVNSALDSAFDSAFDLGRRAEPSNTLLA